MMAWSDPMPMGNLIFALERLNEHRLLSNRLGFLVGQKSRLQDRTDVFHVAVGACASKQKHADLYIDECPPSTNDIYQKVASSMKKYL